MEIIGYLGLIGSVALERCYLDGTAWCRHYVCRDT